MAKKIMLLAGASLFAAAVGAQSLKDGYVTWGIGGQETHTAISTWMQNGKINEDDNFFISRVKPKMFFRNTATQVRQNIDETNDKKLIMWVPIDDSSEKSPNKTNENALPNGVFDSEVFCMWPYVTHYGNWTAPQGRMPGNFADVAHKNGVAVSGVAGVAWAHSVNPGDAWYTCFNGMYQLGAENVANFLNYYGIDGLGYNSEFYSNTVQIDLMDLHDELVEYQADRNPIFENVWYDGTNENGNISFDRGLGSHNDDILAGASLFFNYNWSSLLPSSVQHANANGLNSLNIYAGMNMQGGEGKFWKTLKDYPISIGLWGAHNQNMFWESRHELGSAPAVKLDTYMQRIERWFTGGTRNPANCPEVINSLSYVAKNYNFHGMSSFMSARSTLKWDLATEPFVTYFNLGNGKFFNLNGVRQHNKEWYNIGIQDYLPTWRWWFTKGLMGRTAADVVENGLQAQFVWDDAYFGGSTIRIYGTSAEEYLHLFKTEFDLKAGDVITFRYKLRKGAAKVDLVLTAKGSEDTPIAGDYALVTSETEVDDEKWVECKFNVTDANTLALVALHFENAQNLDMLLGEFSIVRGTVAKPATPVIESSKLLVYNSTGVDGKIIFNMPNNKPAGEVCYNLDVNTSMFRLYAQQEGCEPMLMGATTSWAGLYYSVDVDASKSLKVRFGVSAVSLDGKSESDIAWGEYHAAGTYTYNDNIQINKSMIKPGESFEISYVDPLHEDGEWTITNEAGEVVKTATGKSILVEEGIDVIGGYNVTVNGNVYVQKIGKLSREPKERSFPGYFQITDEKIGALPEIYTLTANDQDADIAVEANEDITLKYTGRKADGIGSQGLDLKENRFGVKCADLGLVGAKSFSVAFWLKLNTLAVGETQLVAVANKLDSWPKTDWGWLWTNIKDDGTMGSYTWRGTDASTNNELRYKFENAKLAVGAWVHIAMTFDYNASGAFYGEFYVNGIKQEITGWNRQSDGDTYKKTQPGYQSNVYNITNGQVLSIGGSAFGRAGIDGALDNVTVWDKALTEEEVKVAMGDLDANNLPANVLAYWDFEKMADDDMTFKSVGQKAGVAAGMHSYEAGTAEGQGYFHWISSEYTSGCPFVTGSAFPVTTVPSWRANRAILSNEEGNDQAGSATVSYKKDGDYTVTLTLANSLGSDSRTFQVIKVGEGATGVASVEAAEVATYAVEGAAIVEFAQEGTYTVSVYNLAGVAVAAETETVAAGATMQIALGAKGAYVVVVEKDGEVVRTVKLLNK